MSRVKTGIKRPYPVEIGFSRDEDEYVARMAFACDMSKSQFIRERTITRKWFEELQSLRKEQAKFPGIYRERTGDYRPDPAMNGKSK